jgi:hypothetical protein
MNNISQLNSRTASSINRRWNLRTNHTQWSPDGLTHNISWSHVSVLTRGPLRPPLATFSLSLRPNQTSGLPTKLFKSRLIVDSYPVCLPWFHSFIHANSSWFESGLVNGNEEVNSYRQEPQSLIVAVILQDFSIITRDLWFWLLTYGYQFRGFSPRADYIDRAATAFRLSVQTNGVHSASWVQMRSYLEEKVVAPV